jgi:hypothetical protein
MNEPVYGLQAPLAVVLTEDDVEIGWAISSAIQGVSLMIAFALQTLKSEIGDLIDFLWYARSISPNLVIIPKLTNGSRIGIGALIGLSTERLIDVDGLTRTPHVTRPSNSWRPSVKRLRMVETSRVQWCRSKIFRFCVTSAKR